MKRFLLHFRFLHLAWLQDTFPTIIAKPTSHCLYAMCLQIHTNKMQVNSFLGQNIDLWSLAGRCSRLDLLHQL